MTRHTWLDDAIDRRNRRQELEWTVENSDSPVERLARDCLTVLDAYEALRADNERLRKERDNLLIGYDKMIEEHFK